MLLDPPKVDGSEVDGVFLEIDKVYTLGRGGSPGGESESDVVRVCLDPEDRDISRNHARVEWLDGSWRITDTSSTQTLLNGNPFVSERLILSDRFRISDYIFEFREGRIVRVDDSRMGDVTASGLGVTVKDRVTGKPLPILKDASLAIRTGHFIGILGGSGQGKSTLLNALCGIRPADCGTVEIGGVPIVLLNRILPGSVGFVPQDDIVHSELVVRDALLLSARLRLPLAKDDRVQLVDRTIHLLGLDDHAGKRVAHLSGGQRKRVSIGIELLSKPSVLFLDEPSSGLDPATEHALMELLQSLAERNNFTVVCTTHVLQKAYIFNRLLFVHGGRIIFEGDADDARVFFFGANQSGGAESVSISATAGPKAPLERIYTEVLSGRKTAEEWKERFGEWRTSDGLPPPEDGKETVGGERDRLPGRRRRVPAWRRFSTLMTRQRKILFADPLNLVFLAGQVVLIGALIAIVSDEFGFRMFLGLIATLWFGCSNGAQQIVAEEPILKREQVCGLGRNVYLASKFSFQGIVSALQGLLLFAIVVVGGALIHPIDFDQEIFEDLYESRLEREAVEDGAQAAGDPLLDDFTVVDEEGDSELLGGPDLSGDESGETTGNEKPSSRFQMPTGVVVIAAKWLMMEDTIIDSERRPMTDSRGTQVLDVDGKPLWFEGIEVWRLLVAGLGMKIAAYVGAALVGVGLGLAVSSWVRTSTQAVMWVPLLLIPQILLGGYVISYPKLPSAVRPVAIYFPSFACQRIIDVSNLYGRATPLVTNLTKNPVFLAGSTEPERIEWTDNGETFSETFDRESYVNISWQNLAVLPERLGEHKKIQESAGKNQYGSEILRKRDSVEARRDVRYEKGTPYLFTFPAAVAGCILGAWVFLTYVLAWLGVVRKTR
ncbi:FHA domain-containing protein [Haloferula sp. A504]|uniref:FHA domain-containing protein n=1 Tax=Haloferula sp. A504 TaxID=3373601 RepID=UPI0031C16073|nr:ATP-binding cassette domain-containing protein [Verrucomicrobiaceae bacterium E54]